MRLIAERKGRFGRVRLHVVVTTSPRSPPLSRLNGPHPLSLSSQDERCNPLPRWWPSACFPSSIPWLPGVAGVQHSTPVIPDEGNSYQVQGINCFPQSPPATRPHIQPGCHQLSPCQQTLLARDLPSARWDSPTGPSQPRSPQWSWRQQLHCAHLGCSGHSHHGHYRWSKP